MFDAEERAGCFALFVFLVSSDCCVALSHDATGLSAVCDCGISSSYSLTIFILNSITLFYNTSTSPLFYHTRTSSLLGTRHFYGKFMATQSVVLTTVLNLLYGSAVLRST